MKNILYTIAKLFKHFSMFVVMIAMIITGAYYFILSLIMSFKYIMLFLAASCMFAAGAFMLSTIVDNLKK
jgi:hypothetical protein